MIPPMSSPEIPDFSTSSVDEKTREKLNFRFAPFLLGLLMKVRLHWHDFARDFALACTFSKENK